MSLMIKVLGLALYGPLAASTRYRLEQYIPGLSEYGIDLQIHHLLGDEYLRYRFQNEKFSLTALMRAAYKRLSLLLRIQQFDAAILYAELFPLMPGWLERQLIKKPYVYDFDDAFYLKYRRGILGAFQPVLGKKIEQVIAGAAAVTAGNENLSAYAQKINGNTHRLPTVVDTERYLPSSRVDNSIFTVGWVGSPTTSSYLSLLVSSLAALGNESAVRFIVIGGKAPLIPNVEVVEKKWSEQTEIDLITSFDVGVMPLVDDEWARGKSAFKLIQYMACGVPVIASPVGANRDVVQKDCGFLAKSTEQWVKAFRFLRDNPKQRACMGTQARLRIETEYSLQRKLPILADVIKSVCGT